MKYEVGMEVERCFDSRWVGPCIVIGVATSVINGTQSINIKYLNNREQDEEFGVLDSFIRLAKTTSVLEKSSTLRQVAWRPQDRPISDLAVRDDFSLNSIRIKRSTRLRLKRTKSVGRIEPYSQLDLRPLADRCGFCNKLCIYRCHSCSLVFYCSRRCQRLAWPKHQLTSSHSIIRYKPPFVPLFTAESLERLSRSRDNSSSNSLVSSDQKAVAGPPSAPFLSSARFVGTDGNQVSEHRYQLVGSSDFTNTIAAATVNESKTISNDESTIILESTSTNVEWGHQMAVNENVQALHFTGASDSDILKALKLNNNDVNEAANWLLVNEAYDDDDKVPALISVPDSVRWAPTVEAVPSAPLEVPQDATDWPKAGTGWSSMLTPPRHRAAEENKYVDDVPDLVPATDPNLDVVCSLCEMLNCSYDDAYNAVKVFTDPNQAAEWVMSHPGEAPSQDSVERIYANGTRRAPTPTAPPDLFHGHNDGDEID